MAYSREIADEILAKMAAGMTLKEICRAEGMPAAPTVRDWVVQNIDDLAERYARARDRQMEHWADEVLEASDDSTNDWMERKRRDGSIEVVLDREHVERSRLRVEARKWLLAKLHPEYRERVQHDVNVNTDLASRLASARTRTDDGDK